MGFWKRIKRARKIYKMQKRRSYRGTWLINKFSADHCKVKRSSNFKKIKRGWKLNSYIIFADYKNRVWICKPGYVWDGPSYPNDKSFIGKFLELVIGDRTKRALVAASAIHDKMNSKSLVYCLSEDEIDELKRLLNDSYAIEEFLNTKELTTISIDIPESSLIYANMIKLWPYKNESISTHRIYKQCLGLLFFQPIYQKSFGSSLWEEA